MGAADALSTITQLALRIAGFSGIVITFSQRPAGLTEIEKFRLGR